MSGDFRCPTPGEWDRPRLARLRAALSPRARRRRRRTRAFYRNRSPRRSQVAPWQPPPTSVRVATPLDMDHSSSSDDLTSELIRQALNGDALARKSIGERLRHVVHMRVTTTLLKSRHVTLNRSLRHEIEDLVQDVFCFLFEKGLAKWEPRGLSLEGWANLLARNYVIDRLRRGPRREHYVGIIDDEIAFDLDASPPPNAEQTIEDADFACNVIKVAKSQLSALDAEMLDAFLEGQTAADVAKRTGRSLAAVERQRSRLLERIRLIAEELRRRSGGKS